MSVISDYSPQELAAHAESQKHGAPGLNSCGFKVFNALVAQNPADNIAVSPTSLGRTLLMAYFGARGSTRDEVASALGMPDQTPETLADWVAASGPSLDRKGVSIGVTDSAWVRSDFTVLPGFINNLQTTFHAEMGSFRDPADGEAKLRDWIAKGSKGLLDGKGFRIGERIVLLLADVMTFDGRWTSVFDKDETKPRPFHIGPSQTIEVPMMRRSGKYAYAESEGYQIIRLPYQNSVYSMFVLQASDSATPSASLDQALFERLAKEVSTCYGDILLPRFSLNSSNNLSATLKASGLDLAFSDAADFSAISEAGLSLSEAWQQVRVSVDEEGTVAAAATVIGAVPRGLPPPFHMEVNRPFYFAIRDESTQAVLFVGRVANPQ